MKDVKSVYFWIWNDVEIRDSSNSVNWGLRF